jgi:hypothetical protein
MPRLKLRSWAIAAALSGGLAGSFFAFRAGPRAPKSSLAPPGDAIFRRGSQLSKDGAIAPGPVTVLGDSDKRVAAPALKALGMVPFSLKPASVIIDLGLLRAPGVSAPDVIEYHREGRAILVGAAGGDASVEMWLHELAHARMAGARPKGALAGRLIDAVEEGVADYFAASIAHNALLGTPSRRRDLMHPPRVGPSEWASLDFDGFDTKRMGWVLAAKFYELQPMGDSLLYDAVACLDGESELGVAADSPGAAIAALLEACPQQGRPRLQRIFQSWLPPELLRSEVPT